MLATPALYIITYRKKHNNKRRAIALRFSLYICSIFLCVLIRLQYILGNGSLRLS